MLRMALLVLTHGSSSSNSMALMIFGRNPARFTGLPTSRSFMTMVSPIISTEGTTGPAPTLNISQHQSRVTLCQQITSQSPINSLATTSPTKNFNAMVSTKLNAQWCRNVAQQWIIAMVTDLATHTRVSASVMQATSSPIARKSRLFWTAISAHRTSLAQVQCGTPWPMLAPGLTSSSSLPTSPRTSISLKAPQVIQITSATITSSWMWTVQLLSTSKTSVGKTALLLQHMLMHTMRLQIVFSTTLLEPKSSPISPFHR